MSLKKYFKDYKKSKKKNKTRKLRKTRRIKKRNKSKKRKITEKNMKGGLKPDSDAIKINKDSPQVNNSNLEDFYKLMEEEGIKYSSKEFDSSILHEPKGDFSRESIDYKILSVGDDNRSITVDTTKRGIRELTEQSSPITHESCPDRVIATINGSKYNVKEIDDNVVTLFDAISEHVVNGTVTISRNRSGDFIIYTNKPTTIRYLDAQAQSDYKSREFELKIGHFSLLASEEDYQAVAREPELVTKDEREKDIILYAGTIMWKPDGSAYRYNNNCGRYAPDDDDADFLAFKNPHFNKNIITATVEETGESKKFYKPHAAWSMWWGKCQGENPGRKCLLSGSAGWKESYHPLMKLRIARDGKKYCIDCFPKREPCLKCAACGYYPDECPYMETWEKAETPDDSN